MEPALSSSRPTSPSARLAIELQEEATTSRLTPAPAPTPTHDGEHYNQRPRRQRRRSSSARNNGNSNNANENQMIVGEGSLINVLRNALTKLLYVCRHGKLPNGQEDNWEGWLRWKRAQGQPPPTGRAKSVKSVVLMTMEQYHWMQRAKYVNEMVDQLLQVLQSVNAVSPESSQTHINPYLISMNSIIATVGDQIAQLSNAPYQPDPPAFLGDRALLYLQQMLLEKGLIMAPSNESLTQQLVHADMTRRASQFIVRLYKLRKTVQKALKAHRVRSHDPIVMQANIILDEYLMSASTTDQIGPGRHDDDGDVLRGSSGHSRITAGGPGGPARSMEDRYRRQMLVQHVLGGHLGDFCTDKQCLMLHLEASMQTQVEGWGWVCCPEGIWATAQVQVSFLIDMTRHSESTGTQYGANFIIKGKPERITSVMDDYYESFSLFADRALWDTMRNNVDTPVAAAAPLATSSISAPSTPNSAAKPVVTTTSILATAGKGKKKIVKKKLAKAPAVSKSAGDGKATDDGVKRIRTKLPEEYEDDDAKKPKSDSGHSLLSMESASGAKRGKVPEKQPRKPSIEQGSSKRPSSTDGQPSRMSSLSSSRRPSADGKGVMEARRPSGDGIPKGSKRVGRSVSPGHDNDDGFGKVSGRGEVKQLGRSSGGSKEVGQFSQSSGFKALRKPSGGPGTSDAPVRRASSSGDTAPSFYDFDEDVDKREIRSITSQLIPEIEKLGPIGQEVAAILRSPSKHAKDSGSKSDSKEESKEGSSSTLSLKKRDDQSEATSDSQPITLRPKPPPRTSSTSSKDSSVMIFQPPGEKLSSTSVRASDLSKIPSTPTTAGYTASTAATTITTVGGASSFASSTRNFQTPTSAGSQSATVVAGSKRSQSAPVQRISSSDPPAFRGVTRSASQLAQIERQRRERELRELQRQQQQDNAVEESQPKSPRHSSKRDAV